MKVTNLQAETNPLGHRIDLSWTNPVEVGFRGVRIFRQQSTFPETDPKKDIPVYSGPCGNAGQSGRFSDQPLQGETVYYYAVFACDEQGSAGAPALIAAMASSAYRSGDELYRLLPALYRNYDTQLPPRLPNVESLDPSDLEKGQLQRLIELFGLQFDLLRSYASALLNFSDVQRIDGSLLPLLAQWIGWPTDFGQSLAKQRNEIRYAPHFYRTTGTAANLRATLNRLVTWDAQVKEFTHNVFRSNAPEELTIREMERRGGEWQPSKPVTLDVAYEGRPAVLQDRDGKTLWLFYHARHTGSKTSSGQPSTNTGEEWHLYLKAHGDNGWGPARRLTFEGEIDKYPVAIQREDGSIWLFWTRYEPIGRRLIPQIKLQVLAAGASARAASLLSREAPEEGFSLADGDVLTIKVDGGVPRTIMFRKEDFKNIAAAMPNEVAAVINHHLPGIAKVGDDGSLGLISPSVGDDSFIAVSVAPPVLCGIRLDFQTDFDRALLSSELLTELQKRGLSIGSGSSIRVEERGFRWRLSTPSQIDVVQYVVQKEKDQLRIRAIATAASVLGFGAPLPPLAAPSEDTEPAVSQDKAGNVWVFWSSQREGLFKIWCNHVNPETGQWGKEAPLTEGPTDREPAVWFEPGDAGKIWLFWSRRELIKQSDGSAVSDNNSRWNIYYRTWQPVKTPQPDGGITWTLKNIDGAESGERPIEGGGDYDNREPAAVSGSASPGEGNPSLGPELYFASNRADGWNIWSRQWTGDNFGDTDDAKPVSSGQFTQRAPVVLATSEGDTRLLFRSNESQVYISPTYPLSRTIDARYGGSTTVDTHNPAKLARQKKLEDIQRYTYDTGKGPEQWYAIDTVGVYLRLDLSEVGDLALIMAERDRIADVLQHVLPIQVRAVFVIEEFYSERIYTYDFPAAEPKWEIGE